MQLVQKKEGEEKREEEKKEEEKEWMSIQLCKWIIKYTYFMFNNLIIFNYYKHMHMYFEMLPSTSWYFYLSFHFYKYNKDVYYPVENKFLH